MCTFFFLHNVPVSSLSPVSVSYKTLKEIQLKYFMHIDLFGKQLCGRKDNDILPSEHIRDNVQPDGHFQKQTPSG